MHKSLRALNRIKDDLKYGRDIWEEDIDTIEDALYEKEEQDEILRIIKEKPAFLQFIVMFDTWEDYYKEYGEWDKEKPHTCYTKAEFDLLKEYFK